MMSAMPPDGGLTAMVSTLETISPVGGVRSRYHLQRDSAQHQQMLHDRLLLMHRSSSSPRMRYDDFGRQPEKLAPVAGPKACPRFFSGALMAGAEPKG